VLLGDFSSHARVGQGEALAPQTKRGGGEATGWAIERRAWLEKTLDPGA